MAKLIGGLLILVLALMALKWAVGMLALAAKLTVVGLLALGVFSGAKMLLGRRN
jgi:hypothetical protein